MKRLCAPQVSAVVLICLVVFTGVVSAQTVPDIRVATSSAVAPERVVSNEPVRAFPYLRLWRGFELKYVGMFSADAVYRTTSKMTVVTGNSPGEGISPAGSAAPSNRANEVPQSMLISVERVVEDFEPPGHAQAEAQAHSRPGTLRNQFLTYAYGHPSVLRTPHNITTDSRHRLVISDPAAGAVHVLDPRGKTSFRIVAGEGRRLHQPQGVAVDANDNIYVADSERGFVVMFDRSGNFVRDIGNFRGEPEYASPHGIAIDQGAGRLYLSDTPRNLVVVLDLDGHVLRQFGKLHDGTGFGEFDHPTDIAVNHKHVFVLDRRGTRIQVIDLTSHQISRFDLTTGVDMMPNGENGLGTDQEGNVYVSWANNGRIWVYTGDGRFLCSFGEFGTRVGEFASPGGLWIDSANRLYVADSGNGRVQLFQLETTH